MSLDQFCLQPNGTAMGANIAFAYINLAMGYWEEQNVWANNLFARHIIFHARYIDDILLNWHGGPGVFFSSSSFMLLTHLYLYWLVFLNLALSHDLN